MNTQLCDFGYEIIEDIYSIQEVNKILELIQSRKINKEFGIREFLKDNPEIAECIFSDKLIEIVKSIAPNCKRSIKSIYFDKPPNSNWIVNWHQDLTINLEEKIETANYKNWRIKEERTIVQPNKEFLEDIFTIRVHLDNCNKENGALRVIEKSHKFGVIEIKEWIKDKKGVERVCEVNKGGIVLMRPLILHSSRRTENQKNRRVIHIEFTDRELPNGLNWKEEVLFRTV